jgi:phosphatidylserine synthase
LAPAATVATAKAATTMNTAMGFMAILLSFEGNRQGQGPVPETRWN